MFNPAVHSRGEQAASWMFGDNHKNMTSDENWRAAKLNPFTKPNEEDAAMQTFRRWLKEQGKQEYKSLYE